MYSLGFYLKLLDCLYYLIHKTKSPELSGSKFCKNIKCMAVDFAKNCLIALLFDLQYTSKFRKDTKCIAFELLAENFQG